MTSRSEDARALAESTLEELEVGGASLTPIVLRCLRLARLLEKREAERWFALELRGYSADVFGDNNWAPYAKRSGREAGKDPNGSELFWTSPIEQIETALQLAMEEFHACEIPKAIPEPSEKVAMYSSLGQTATERVISAVEAKRRQKVEEVTRWTHIVATVRGAIHEWLSRTAISLAYGSVLNSAFERAKERFDRLLSAFAPEAGRVLAAAFARANSGDPEEWSQALSSCRRSLKVLADAIYPPTTERPAGRDLTEENYKNRLIQFASEHLRSDSQRELLLAEIDNVAARADAINSLASKGVHSEVEDRDLELAVVYTYLLAGHLLTLLPEQPVVAEAATQQINDQAIAEEAQTAPPNGLQS